MSDAVAIAKIIVCAFSILAAGWIGAFIYQRGTARAAVHPTFTPKNAPKPTPKHLQPKENCPYCRKTTVWLLADDESVWTCGHCERDIAGPKPRIIP